MANQILTAEYLRSRLDYDSSTGVFTHKHDFGSRYKVGDRADTSGHAALREYRLVNLLNQKFLAHRAAWLHTHGIFPGLPIDHINGNKSDNRIENLRAVEIRLNAENIRKPQKNNSTGFLGVQPHQGRYRVRLTVDRKQIQIGMFSTPEEAHAAYVVAKRKYHEGCTI